MRLKNSTPFLALHTLRDPSHGHPTMNVALNCNYDPDDYDQGGLKQVYWEDWRPTDADTGFRENTAPLRHARFILGLYSRKQLKSFVETVLDENTPVIFKQATLRYGIWDGEAVKVGVKNKWGNLCKGAWRQTSLASEELTGMTFIFPHTANTN